MRFALVAAVFSAVVSAGAVNIAVRQDGTTLPDCASSCLLSPKNLFGCSATDNQCLCTNQQYVAETTLCIQGVCSASDTAEAEAFSRAICEQLGITLTSTPTAAPTGASTSGSDSASSTPSPTDSGASSSTPAGSSTPSAPASSNTAPTSSGSSSSSSSSSSGSSSTGAPAPSNTSNAAVSNSAGTLLGLAALALAALNF